MRYRKESVAQSFQKFLICFHEALNFSMLTVSSKSLGEILQPFHTFPNYNHTERSNIKLA